MSDPLQVNLVLQVGALSIAARIEVGARGLILVGPNGAGKTSLLLALLGILPAKGRVAIGGRVLTDSAAGIAVPPDERRLGYVPQDYALFPHLSAAENVTFALACGDRREPARARRSRALSLLNDVGIGDIGDRRPDALSGGERQRVALARALAVAPHALLLDEPFAALDVETRDEVRGLVGRTLRALDRPFVVVTHDLADAAALTAPVAVMEEGRIVQRGELAELTRAPATPYVARLTGSRG